MEPSIIPQPGEEAGTWKPATAKRRRSFVPMWAIRTTSVLLIAGLLVYGSICKSGYGNLCALDSDVFGVACPLGFLGAAFASRSLLPRLWLSAGTAVVLIILFGRFFCAWVCPASVVQSLIGKVRLKTFQSRWPRAMAIKSKRAENGTAYSSLAMLAGALVSSYLFGFPVFCLICPVGLTFRTIFAVVRWFSGAPPGLELAVFPVMIIAELFMLKSWCRSLCPLGALLGLVSRLNFLLRPKLKQDECLGARGLNCRICERTCPQGMTREEIEKGPSPAQCTKCFECYEKCPVGAIHIKAFRAG
jgi:ferredoxin-type protein NapH